MKRVFSLIMVCLLCLSMFSIFAPKAKADSAYLTDIVQLTTNPYDDRGAGWFPDSSKIAYSAFADSWYRNIWVMNSDGSNKEQLTFGSVVDDAPAYSPDGTKIVFMRYGLRGIDGSDLMMMNADGTNIQQLTSTGLHRGQPRWSHDGQRLAFYYGGAGTTTNEIHIMNTDGTNEVTVASGTYPVMNPYWSPDETKLVYTMDDGIWTVNTSPPYQKTRVFQTSLPTMYAVFSPDGKYIMYASGVYVYGQHQDLYLIDIYGNFIAQLTYDTKFGYLFDWSPDGHYIAFNSISSGNYDVWRARIVTDSGLVGYWKFDEGSEALAHDSSGNGNTGTLNNGPQWVDGKFGKALSFDGNDDYVQVPQSSSLDVTSQVTVEAWVYPRAYVDSNGDNSHIVSRCAVNGGAIYVLQTYSPTSTKAGYAVNQLPYHHASSADLPLNTWTHLAMTYDGSYVRLYINGEFDSSYAQSGPIETTPNWLAIGCKPTASFGGPGTYAYFNGMIDEVKIYNYARCANQIAQDYETQYYLQVATDPSGLPSIPGADWYNNWTWVSLTAPQYVPNETGVSGFRYNFTYWDIDGASQGVGVNPINVHMDAQHIATAHFTAQWHVTFDQTGVGPDFTGTVVTIDGSNYRVSDLPVSFWYDNGTSHSFAFQAPLIVGSGAKQYDWTSTTGLSSLQSGSITVTDSGSVTGNYVTRIHDVAVTSVAADRSWVYQGFTANVSVTVVNKGDFAENVAVTLYYNITANQVIGTQSISLSLNESKTIVFVWNTTGVPYCHNYTITAVATIAADYYPADNTLADGGIKVRVLGDLNGDGYVGVDDIFAAGHAFGTEPGDPRWNVDADLNRDNYIGIDDLYIFASQFGQGC